MKRRLPLSGKVLFLAFLNLCLLALALALIARAQFRLDPGSFLLAPAEGRIMAMAHAVALELEETPPDAWSQVLARFSERHGVTLLLFDESGDKVAGPEVPLPRAIFDRIPRREPPRGGPKPPAPQREPERGRVPRPPAPPLFLTATGSPAAYWAGARIPLRRDRREDPHPGSLVMMSRSLLSSSLFFDATPWLIVGAAVILVSVACWLPFIRGVTHAISQMTRAAGRIAEGQFEVHVADRRRDEIGQLGETVNRMASRLAGFVNGQKRFLSGIAHELCNPIATMQFGLGNLERRVDEDLRPSVVEIQEELQHMSLLVNELLAFTRAGLQVQEVTLASVNLAAVVARAVEREAPAGTGIVLSVDERLNAMADAELLFRAVSNVLRNAIRYAGQAGPIRISARADAGMVYLTVADSGPGVPEESLEEVFAPFYRLDPSRDPQTGGLGLGLAIVRTCVESCHGAVRCRNLQPSGLEVEIRLSEAEL